MNYDSFEVEREVIYSLLREEIPALQRRRATPRVLAPIDVLLDTLLELEADYCAQEAEQGALEAQDIEMGFK